MLKKVDPKNKKTVFFIILIALLLSFYIISYIIYPYINIYLILNTLPFLCSAHNSKPTFYGENIDMSQILPTSQHYIVNSKGEDLIDIAASLGVNLVRLTNAQRSFDTNADSVYTWDQWNQVLSKMQCKGIKALILIETDSDNGDYYTPDIRPSYLNLVQNYIDSGVFSHPDIYAVDIKNEPLLTDANLKMLETAHTMIKAKYPNLLQTIGWWATPNLPNDPYNPNTYNWADFSAGQKIANIVDFYSIHMYGLATDHFGINLTPNQRTKVFLSRVQNGLQTKKPLLIGEFGEANGDAVSDQETIGSPELQAYVYRDVYRALTEMCNSQIIGTVAFDFYSRDQYPDAWAIVKNKGDYLFPAAYVLQAYALGKQDSSIPTVDTSQSYLLKNAANRTVKDLHVSDRIGLKLQLDQRRNYAISLSANGLLQPINVFHYDVVANSYYAVYQAVSAGSLKLKIIPDTNCVPRAVCATPVYTLTLNIR